MTAHAFLRCPVDHGLLIVTPEGLANVRLGITYPVIDGIPDLRTPDQRHAS